MLHPKPKGSVVVDNSTLKPNSEYFFDFPWNPQFAGEYGNAESPVVPNGQYAVKGPHPSEMVTAYDLAMAETKGLIYADSVFTIGAHPLESMLAKSVQGAPYLTNRDETQAPVWVSAAENLWRTVGPGEDPASEQGNGVHMYNLGSAECLWIRHCDADELLGSSCNATQSGVFYDGFCFHSDTGSLECGRTMKIDGQNVPAERPHRCPTGSPARSLGTYQSRRLPVAGCLITYDAQYDPLADVHVPEYCARPADFRLGCLLHGATNYDPTARQNGRCTFTTTGCISSTALNYNPIASSQDPLTPCIEPVRGCTVQAVAYAGVPEDVPAYRSGYYGSALRGVGVVPQTTYNGPAVLNFNDMANVLSRCMVAVEGCMDTTAVNYEPSATTNSGTWCIPPVPGCMMPNELAANDAYRNPEVTSNAPYLAGRQLDGLSINFNTAATIHVRSQCVVARYGCGARGAPTQYPGYPEPMAAINYDPMVTVETGCYWPLPGCLNHAALNFGCKTSDSTSPCFYDQNVTVHVPSTCVYIWDLNRPKAPPAAPPSPATPPGIDVITTFTMVVTITVGGTVDYFTDPVKALAIVVFKQALNLPTLNVTLTVTAASVILEFTFITTERDEADAFERSVATNIGTTAASAQVAFGDALGVQVLRGAQFTRTETRIEFYPPPLSPPPPDPDRTAALAAAGGSVVLIIIICCLACGIMLKRAIKAQKAADVYLIDPNALPELKEGEQRPTGLRWRKVGDERPGKGYELFNSALATALTKKPIFGKVEFQGFAIPDLRRGHFILADDGVYYRPTFPRPVEAQVIGGKVVSGSLTKAPTSAVSLRGSSSRVHPETAVSLRGSSARVHPEM